KLAGYDPGPIDGRWGPRTKAAYDNCLAGAIGRIATPPKGGGILNTTSYRELRPEYERLFANCKVLDEYRVNVQALVDHVLTQRLRYESVGKPLGTPWWMI